MATKAPKTLRQTDLVAAILKELDRQGIKSAETRFINACIKGADDIIAEIERPAKLADRPMDVREWLASDDTGMSSKYLARVLFAMPTPQGDPHVAYPWDPQDFGRCYRMLKCCKPREGIEIMKTCGPVWKKYAENWDEMTRLWEEESPSGNAPKLYELMRKLRDEAEGQ